MKSILFFIILAAMMMEPVFSQDPSKNEMQSQMQEAIDELNKQIADLEKEIAVAKKNKEDPESIQQMEKELTLLKKQVSMMAGLNKNVSKLPESTTTKANPFKNTDGKIFPVRKKALLESLPKRTINKQELTNFLTATNAELKVKLPAETVKNADAVISKSKGELSSLSTAGALAWYCNAPSESLLLLTYAASKSPDDNTLNNCAAVFNLSGLEDRAIPVLQYVLANEPTNSTVLNNLGQAYAGLGELDTAMRYLRAAMAQSPSHPEACATAAYIEAERGNNAEAVRLMTEAAKTGYSDRRVKFLENKDPDRSNPWFGMGDIDLKNKYYMTGDFDLPPNCRNWGDCEEVYEMQQAFEKKIKAMAENYTNVVLQNSNVPITGKVSPWNEAIYFKIKQIGDDYSYRRQMDFDLLWSQIKTITDNSASELQTLDKRFEPEYAACSNIGGDCLKRVAYRYCRERTAIEDRYHNALADVAENFQHIWYPQDLEYHNKIVWLESLRSTDGRILKAEQATQSNALLQQLLAYTLSVCDPAGKPDCEQYNPANPANQAAAKYIDANCPINIIVPAGAIKMNLNCSQFKMDIGEGIVFTYEKDFNTKETTLAIGPGANLGNPVIEVGVKAQAYVKFDGNNQPVDMGVSGEAELEIAGPISPVVKSGFQVGINSGVTPVGELKPFVGMSNFSW